MLLHPSCVWHVHGMDTASRCLSESNFFYPIVDKYGLLGSDTAVREEEGAAVKRVRIDENGSRACAMFEVWAFEVIQGEARRSARCEPVGDLTPPIQAALQHEINLVGTHIKRLFAYRYQVMPFIYTHLVSLSCFVYLAASAFLAGLSFTPESTALFGCAQSRTQWCIRAQCVPCTAHHHASVAALCVLQVAPSPSSSSSPRSSPPSASSRWARRSSTPSERIRRTLRCCTLLR